MKNHKTFGVNFTIAVHEDNNILSSHDEAHAEDVLDLVEAIFFDVDDVKIKNLTVKEQT